MLWRAVRIKVPQIFSGQYLGNFQSKHVPQDFTELKKKKKFTIICWYPSQKLHFSMHEISDKNSYFKIQDSQSGFRISFCLSADLTSLDDA